MTIKVNVGDGSKEITANVGAVTSRVKVQSPLSLVRRDPTTYNILIIVLDDIGPEFFDFYSSGIYEDIETTKAKTPNLTALAEAGIIFDNAYAAPVCSPTRAQINTGYYPHRTGQGTTNSATENPTTRLSDSLTWLPEALRDGRGQGVYFRSAWGKWHMCTPIPGALPTGNDGHPKDNGYQRYAGQMINASSNVANGDYDHYIWRYVTNSGSTVASTQIGDTADYLDNEVDVPPSNTSYNTDDNWNAGRNARDFVTWANAQTRPFVAYFCPNPPHAPYQVPPYAYLSAETVAELEAENMPQGFKVDPEADIARTRLVFRACMEAVDYQIGYIRTNLNSAKRDNLMTIVVGDNGTEQSCIDETEDAPLTKSHSKRTVYEQGARVPLVVHGPLVGAPGRRSSHFVHVVDIYRTVIDMSWSPYAFTKAPTDTHSISFFPVIRNPDAPQARSRVWTHTFTPNMGLDEYPANITRDTYAIRDARWKYVSLFANNVSTEQFFDLQSDPWEANNLYASGPSGLTAEQLSAFLRLKGEAAAILAS